MTSPQPLNGSPQPPLGLQDQTADTGYGSQFDEVVFPEPKYPPESLSDAQVLKMYKDKITKVVTEDIDLDLEPERYIQVGKALRNSLYWRAMQYLSLGFRPDDPSGSVNWFSSDFTGQSGAGNQGAAFRYVFNVTRGDGQKFTAVLGQRAPHVEAVADDTESEAGDDKQRQANAVFRYLHDDWNADSKQKDVARTVWRTGPAFATASFVTNGAKNGWSEVPQVKLVEQEIAPEGFPCPNCGEVSDTPHCDECDQDLDPLNWQASQSVTAAVKTGMKRYPKGKVELKLYTVLEVTHPAAAKSIEECNHICIETDEHIADLLATYAVNSTNDSERAERLRKIIKSEGDGKDMTGGKQIASDARAVLLSQTVIRNPSKNMRRFSRYWLRPAWYEMFDLEDNEREIFRIKYPKGIKLTYISGELIDLIGESPDDVISVFKTGTDEKILADPIVTDLIPIQDIINHHFNLAEEIVMRSIQKVGLDPAVWDRQSMLENDPMPGEAIFAKPNASGGLLSNSIAPFPTAKINENLVPLAELYRTMSRELDGVLEAIFGGGATSGTWREAAQKKNQALMQLGSCYDEMKLGWQQTYENGAKEMARYSTSSVRIPSGDIEGGTEYVNWDALLEGGWHAEADEGVPMTHAEEVDRALYLAGNVPIIAEKLELFSDNNSKRLSQLFNIRGLKSRKVQEMSKFNNILVTELLQGQPLPPPLPLPPMPDPVTGMMMPPPPPPPPQPSVPIDMFEDDHNFMAQAARDWMNSRAGQQMKITNRPAYDNVLAWGMAHQAAAAPPPMMPPPGSPTAPSGPPKPHAPHAPRPPHAPSNESSPNTPLATGGAGPSGGTAQGAPGGSAQGAQIPQP